MKFTGLERTRIPLILVFTCLVISINACGQSPASAKPFIAGLYESYQSPKEPDFLGKAADTLFDPDLLSLIRKDQKLADVEVGILDYDPVCDCQDFDISNVRIDAKKSGKSSLEAEVHFTNSGSEVNLGFTLKGDGKRWKIADIRSRSTPSLYRLLQTQLNSPAKGK
ncbi:MAG: YbjP/YqhG family protein [Fibrobacterota bacterium]|nr:YbjP/YqhG family protein [Fibrobacterota bacterium]